MDLVNKQSLKPHVYGMADVDYPNSEAFGISIFPKSRQQSFPQELEDQFKHMQSNFSTGLFPLISRAWMAIDSDLFLWNFETNTDLAFFDGISNTILLVELCKPRVSFSNSEMHFFLVVATTVEILLLPLTFHEEAGNTILGEKNLYKNSAAFLSGNSLYKLPLEGLIVSNLRCSQDGRIFFSADDCFYELEYYDRTWYSGHSCKKINHSKSLFTSLVPVLSIFSSKDEIRQLELDDSRHLLYVLHKKGSIQIFDLGVDGKSIQKFCTFQREQLEHDSTALCNVTPEYFKEVVSVSAVPLTSSYNIYFILTTAKGVRIYLTCLQGEINPNSKYTQEQIRPKTVRIVQIRFPPSEQSFSLKGVNIYSCFISGDTCLMASDLGADQSNFWIFTSSNFSCSPRSDEHNIVIPIHGAVWTINKAIENMSCSRFSNSQVGFFLPREEKPLIVRQHLCRSEKFYVLTSKGVLTFLHLSPVEVFRKILLKFGPESKEFQAFIAVLPKYEVCIMAIIVLCSDNPMDNNIKDVALRAFFVHGGEPHMSVVVNDGYANGATNGRNGMIDARPHSSLAWNTSNAGQLNSPKTPFQSARLSGFFSAPLRTSTPQDTQTPSPRDRIYRTANGAFSSPIPDDHTIVTGSPTIVNSARHDALHAYYTRILAPIFNRQLCYVENDQFSSCFSAEIVDEVTRFVAIYKRVIEENSLISTATSMHSSRQHINDPRDAACKEQEKISLSNLRNDISYTLEVLGLWGVLLEFKREDFNVIISSLSANLQRSLIGWEFEDLQKNRDNICAELIACIVRFFIGDDASTLAISKRLRDTCPSIFTLDDAQVVKATENLYRVKTIANAKERKQLISEAILTLQQSIHKLNLVQTCDLLIQIGHFEGIVDLALAKAENDDKGQLALIAYKRQITEINGMSGDAAELSDAIHKRNDAYACITEALEILHIVAQTKSTVSSVTLNASTFLFPSADAVKNLSAGMAKVERDAMLARVFASDDELANVAVFRWMLSHGMANILLDNKCHFFEAFLLHEIEQGKSGKFLDLLWKFNEKTGNYADAAKILYDMAKKIGNRTTLNQRIVYLSQALVCIQTDAENKANTEFKIEIQDTLDVAQLQLRTKNTLESEKTLGQFADQKRLSDAISTLNYGLYNVTEIYQQFAAPFNLYEIQLDILHCAGHYDKDTVEKIWSCLLKRELENFSNKSESEAAAQGRLGSLLLKMRKHFLRSLQFVPYSFILRYLLSEGLKKSVSAEWLPNICKTGEVPYNILLSVAEYELRIGDPFWKQNPRALQFITDLIVVVCKRFKTDHQRIPHNDRKVLRDECLNCLAELILETSNNRRAENLELLQAEINRIV